MALPTEALMPAANTVTNTTTARPIISAPAVTAVRPGLRTAFSRARRPVMPLSFSSGQPQIEASGRTSRGLNIETPKSVATAPPPTSAAAALASSVPPKRPAHVIPMPARKRSTAKAVKMRPRVRLSGSSASSSAAIGVTRVARSAGTSAEASVTRIPTASATTIVRVSITVPVFGRSMPKRLEDGVERRRRTRCRPARRGRAEHSEQQRLEDRAAEDLAAAGAQRAQQPELADPLGDRDREDVEDQEAAHQQRHAAEHEQHDAEELEVVLDVLRLASGGLVAGLHHEPRRQHAIDPLAQLAQRSHPAPP